MQDDPISSCHGAWNEPARRTLRRLNLLVLARMHELAAGLGPAVPAVAALRPLWCAASPLTLERLGGCPFLLIEPVLPPRLALPDALLPSPWTESFPLPHRERLAHSIVVYLWQLARDSRSLACTLSEATPADLAALAAQDSDEIATLAERLAPDLRPRWADRPAIWRSLIDCATRSAAEAPLALSVRGLQLLAGERLRSRPPSDLHPLH